MKYDPNDIANVDLYVKFHLANLFMKIDYCEEEGDLPRMYNLLNIVYKRLLPLMEKKKYDTQKILGAIKNLNEDFKTYDVTIGDDAKGQRIKEQLNVWITEMHRFCIKMSFWLKTGKGFKESMGFTSDDDEKEDKDEDKDEKKEETG
jgi:hypothetical protein